jgi:hypothetical protein
MTVLTLEMRELIRKARDQRARELLRDQSPGSVTCEMCDMPIEAKRASVPKRFCNASCRKRWNDRYSRPLKVAA